MVNHIKVIGLKQENRIILLCIVPVITCFESKQSKIIATDGNLVFGTPFYVNSTIVLPRTIPRFSRELLSLSPPTMLIVSSMSLQHSISQHRILYRLEQHIIQTRITYSITYRSTSQHSIAQHITQKRISYILE